MFDRSSLFRVISNNDSRREETKANSGGGNQKSVYARDEACHWLRKRIILEKLAGIEKPWKVAIKRVVGGWWKSVFSNEFRATSQPHTPMKFTSFLLINTFENGLQGLCIGDYDNWRGLIFGEELASIYLSNLSDNNSTIRNSKRIFHKLFPWLAVIVEY